MAFYDCFLVSEGAFSFAFEIMKFACYTLMAYELCSVHRGVGSGPGSGILVSLSKMLYHNCFSSYRGENGYLRGERLILCLKTNSSECHSNPGLLPSELKKITGILKAR